MAKSAPIAGRGFSNVFSLVVAGLVLGSVFVLVPFVTPLVLGAWTAELTRPILVRAERLFFGRRAAATAITMSLLLLIVAPLAAAVTVLVVSAGELVAQLRTALESGSLSKTLAPAPPNFEHLMDLARTYGPSSLRVLGGTLRGSMRAVVSLVVFLGAGYSIPVHREQLGAWVARSVPMPPGAFERLTNAFYETGRGLIIGVGLTALVQGVIAMIAYLALGIPQAPVFGFLTALAAIVPSVGTGFVWGPIAVVLAATGHPGRALILLACGVGVISVVDNVLRPILARFGKLDLPAFVLFLSMLGGVFAIGPSGLVMGPLLVRMAVEAVDIWRAPPETSAVAAPGE
jgi:predicted PurR-regulated permease PerM